MSQDFCNHCHVITVISGGDELLRIPHTAGGLLLPFLIEENAKFQLEVSENEGITFLPVGSSQFYPGTSDQELLD